MERYTAQHHGDQPERETARERMLKAVEAMSQFRGEEEVCHDTERTGKKEVQ